MAAKHVIIAALVSAAPALASTPYPAMAPLPQYMMARDAEIALARSAAPASISAKANVLVMGQHGYQPAATGSNGFTCLVERSWMSAFDDTEFWNPKERSPICYNAAAAASVLPYTTLRTKMALRGETKAQMLTDIQAAVARKDLKAPAPGAMSYMLSHQQYLADAVGAAMPHLMFHIPKVEAASWGANAEGSPVFYDSDHVQVPEPEIIFMVSAKHWSDGTPAVHQHH